MKKTAWVKIEYETFGDLCGPHCEQMILGTCNFFNEDLGTRGVMGEEYERCDNCLSLEDNGDLFAATPLLLKELEVLVKCLRVFRDVSKYPSEVKYMVKILDSANAAIAAAKPKPKPKKIEKGKG